MGSLRYILLGLVIYWVFKRIVKVTKIVRNNGQVNNDPITPEKPNDKSTVDHSKGGEYVEYEEVED